MTQDNENKIKQTFILIKAARNATARQLIRWQRPDTLRAQPGIAEQVHT